MRISDWSSDVCSSDLRCLPHHEEQRQGEDSEPQTPEGTGDAHLFHALLVEAEERPLRHHEEREAKGQAEQAAGGAETAGRSEEHTSELQSLMRISYAVFSLKNNKTNLSKEHNIRN